MSIVAYFRVEQIDFEIEFRLTNFIWGLTIPDCTFELIVILKLSFTREANNFYYVLLISSNLFKRQNKMKFYLHVEII